MNRGLFNLEGFAEKSDDDIMELNMNEAGAAEFANNSPANPNAEFDNNATSAHDINVSVPGGLKETPTAKPADGEKGVPVPGGLKETPTGKPYDAASVSVPAAVTLTADQYNNALSALKKSFKEGYEILDLLESANVVHQSVEELQESYMDDTVGAAMLEAYENGPIFESVNRADKKEVKAICNNIRKKMEQLNKSGIKFYKPAKFIRMILGGGRQIGTDDRGVTHRNWWNTRFWQIIGAVQIDIGSAKELCNELTNQFAEDLNGYKILAINMPGTICDAFRAKFNWKGKKGAYFLIVDHNISADIKNAVREMADSVEKDDKGEAKKEEPKADDKNS